MNRQIASTGEIVEEQPSGQLTTAAKTIHVKVYSPFKVYFDEAANSISALNATGPFDILPRHHNFMTLLLPCELLIRTPRGDQRIKISHAMMHVKANKVIVFLDV